MNKNWSELSPVVRLAIVKVALLDVGLKLSLIHI